MTGGLRHPLGAQAFLPAFPSREKCHAGRDACAPGASGSAVKLAQFSKRFHH